MNAVRISLLLALVACKSTTPRAADPAPASTESGPTATPAAECDAPPPGEVLSEVQCTCQGARINASPGGGDQPHCDRNESELGPVRFGIEGGWCCLGGNMTGDSL